MNISTHTLTWSVTRFQSIFQDRPEYFNSHAHVERDEQALEYLRKVMISTHTLTWSVTDSS